MKFRPTDDNVLVRILRPADSTSAGIVLPQQREKRLQAVPAVVIATGPGALAWRERLFPSRANHPVDDSPRVYAGERIEPSVAEGDIVLLDTHLAGQPWTVDGVEHRIVRECAIIAVTDTRDEDEARRDYL